MRPLKRVAVTIPPSEWFHGIDRILFGVYRAALVELGLEVFDVAVDAFLPPDAARLARLIPEIRAFQPQLVLGLPHGAYALICRMPAGPGGRRANLFTEVLDVPTLCKWDHAPLDLADQLLSPHPEGPRDSRDGAHGALRQALGHPRLVHWSKDSGQTGLMEVLGFAETGRVIHEGSPGLPGFDSSGPSGTEGVGFIGHIYPEPEVYPDPALATLADEAIQGWSAQPEAALWHVLEARIAALPNRLKRRLALHPSQTWFWHFAHRLIIHRAQTALRMRILGAAGVPVICYGNLRPAAGMPMNLVARPGSLAFGPELAAVFARHAILVDVLNPGFMGGYSHKPLMGFSCGGFVLVNRKRDFVTNFGDAGEAVSYGDGEELAGKIEYYLAHPKERLEVGREMRERIRAQFQLRDVLSRVLGQAMEQAGAVPPSPKLAAPGPAVVVGNLLTDTRLESGRSGATLTALSDGVRITTPSAAWAYAAVVPVPVEARSLKKPHVRMRLRVEAGRVGIGALLKDMTALSAEQVVSRGDEPVTLTVELAPKSAGAVVIRNTSEGVSQAVLLEASLCDRP